MARVGTKGTRGDNMLNGAGGVDDAGIPACLDCKGLEAGNYLLTDLHLVYRLGYTPKAYTLGYTILYSPTCFYECWPLESSADAAPTVTMMQAFQPAAASGLQRWKHQALHPTSTKQRHHPPCTEAPMHQS